MIRISNCKALCVFCILGFFDVVWAATTCDGSNTPLSANYLAAMVEARAKGSHSSNYAPSAYFLGKATKFVTSKPGLTQLNDFTLCVDGNTRPEPIQLFDDGTNGDDVAGDGVFSRACVHFCESTVDLNDVWGFAKEILNSAGEARLVVVDPSLEGTIPSETLPAPPQYPGASMIATSHAAFFVDSNRTYFPEWPLNVRYEGGVNKDSPSGRSTAVGSFLVTFGDVFDYVTVTGLEQNREVQGAAVFKWQQWETSGAPLPNTGAGEVDSCSMAVTGVPVMRLSGVISTGNTVNSGFMNHELVHGVSGYSYHMKMGDRAVRGDNAHVPGTCTVDHSSLQGPIWDWEKGFPVAIPMGYCKDKVNCFTVPGDLVRLEANQICDSCPEDELEECCTFRLTDAILDKSDMEARPDLFTMSPLMKYIGGFLPIDQVPDDEKTFYCLGTDEDFACGSQNSGVPCLLAVDESDRSQVKANKILRFTFDELVAANGPRFPPKRAISTLRHGAVYLSQREPSDAERVFYTMLWRHWEVETRVHERVLRTNGEREEPLVTWAFETQGLSNLHSRLHGIPCGGGMTPPSCQDPQDDSICAQASCSNDAVCIPFDNLPLCICKDGLVGDGTLCLEPSESTSYPLPSAHELFAQDPRRCFGNGWPGFVDESSLPRYPGGVTPFAVATEAIAETLPPTPTPTTLPTPTPTSPPTPTPTPPPTDSPVASEGEDDDDDDVGVECLGQICPSGWNCNIFPSHIEQCGRSRTFYHRFNGDGDCRERCRRDRPSSRWPIRGTCPAAQCVPGR